MGYTHYFPQQRAFTDQEWIDLCAAAFIAIDYASKNFNIEIQRDYDDEAKPEINDEHIWLNGVGDEGHETFYITKDKMDGFNFCKTAQKPYDMVVGLILLSAHQIAPDALDISSDGDWNDHEEWKPIVSAYEKMRGLGISCPWNDEDAEADSESDDHNIKFDMIKSLDTLFEINIETFNDMCEDEARSQNLINDDEVLSDIDYAVTDADNGAAVITINAQVNKI